MKIVINTCYGGFSISKECAELMAKNGCPIAKKDLKEKEFYGYDYNRTSKFLIEAVDKLGKKANNQCSALKVIEIPDGINYYINDYDGMESVEEAHKSWS